MPVLGRTLHDYAVGELAYTTRCLFAHGELDAIRLWRWWPRHFASDLWRLLRGDERALPPRLIAAEAAGLARGPWLLWRSRRNRPAVPALLPSRERPTHPDVTKPPPAAGDESPSLSVVIASRNRRDRLRQVLMALAQQTYPLECFEAVVVIDGSTDGSAEMVRQLALPYRVKVLEQTNRGLAATRNRGAREATHDLVVFLDDDIFPEPGFLAEHARAHDERSGHVALGYYPPFLSERSFWAYAVRAWWEDHFRRKAEPAHQWTYIDYADGNCSMSRAVLFDAGGYDESFRGRRQDWELGIRLLERGVRFAYHPLARGSHHLDTSFATAIRQARQEAKDDVLLARKHPRVRGQLPLAGDAGPGPAASRRVRLVYSRPAVAEALVRAGPATADRLELLRLRPQWHRQVHRLLRLSYLLGIARGAPLGLCVRGVPGPGVGGGITRQRARLARFNRPDHGAAGRGRDAAARRLPRPGVGRNSCDEHRRSVGLDRDHRSGRARAAVAGADGDPPVRSDGSGSPSAGQTTAEKRDGAAGSTVRSRLCAARERRAPKGKHALPHEPRQAGSPTCAPRFPGDEGSAGGVSLPRLRGFAALQPRGVARADHVAGVKGPLDQVQHGRVGDRAAPCSGRGRPRAS